MKLTNSDKNRLKQAYGPWAVVTGASSGIGLELAGLLAEAGLNLVISARGGNTLEQIAQRLIQQHAVDVRVVAADLAEPAGAQTLIDQTKELPVGLLVASAGYGTSGRFLDTPLADELGMVQVNCVALLALTHHYGRRFSEARRGGIVLLSSIVAFQGVPFSANYAATKAYVQSLAEALARELKPHNVDVLAAAPGPVVSGFGQRANMRMSMALTTAQVGGPILRALGRQTTVFPGFLSKLLVYSLRTVPRWGKIRIMQWVMGGMTIHQR